LSGVFQEGSSKDANQLREHCFVFLTFTLFPFLLLLSALNTEVTDGAIAIIYEHEAAQQAGLVNHTYNPSTGKA
jgi:hypothetical protein